MKNLIKPTLAKVILASVLLVAVIALAKLIPDNRVSEYESYLINHPYNQTNSQGIRYEDIPKRDRPDLAWQQDFLATMDPKLKRPTPEKLIKARAEVKSYFENQKSARTGTQEFPWVERGPSNIGGRTRAIMWDPNDATGKKVWAGGVTGGLWYTTDIYDANVTWTKVDDFWDNISIVCIAYDPNNSSIFYVGTGEGFGAGASRGAGIWKTLDGGQTWSQLPNSSSFYYVNDIIVRNESGNSVLYAGVRGNYYEGEWHGTNDTGLFRSVDGGANYSQVLPNISGTPYAPADIELGAENRIWVGSQSNPFGDGGGTILYSDDGNNWTVSTTRSDAGRVELATAPSNKDVVYALIEGDGVVKEVIKTTDRGASWNNLPEPNDSDPGIPASDFTRGQAWYDLIMTVDPNDANTVLAGGIDLFKSTDGGTNWTQISHWYGGFGFPNVHADQHSMAFKPGSSTDIIFGNDGGMYVSTNMTSNSPSFTNRNNNYNVTQFYAAALHPDQGKNYFLAGSQDNGTQRFQESGLNATTEAYGGDGAYCFIDQKNGNIQIVSYVRNVYALSTNGGNSFNDFVDDQNSGSFINPADYDDNLGVMFSGASENSIARFLDIKTGSPNRNDINIALGSDATHFRVSPYTTASSTLYVGTQAGSLYKLTDANGSPSSTNIKGASFPDGSISCIELGASENEILVTFSNYGVTSVWYTSDGGSNWISKEGDLPDMPVRWALFNPNNRSEVILATELGIWRTENFDNANPTWAPSNIGLANVRVDMLQIRDSDNEVIAATFGRGLYSSSGFSTGTNTELSANFSASVSNVEVGGSVSFSDNSTGSPIAWSWTFEGGTPNTSDLQNPTVTYSTPGSYDVTLQVTNAQNETSTKTLQEFITVNEQALSNLVAYQPDGWGNSITISNNSDDFTNTAQIGSQDDIFLSYAIANLGDTPIDQEFKVSIDIDGSNVGTTNWDYNSSTTLTNGFFVTWENEKLAALAEGEHTVTITLDSEGTLSETNEADNTATYTFMVLPSCGGATTLTSDSGTIEDGSGSSNYFNSRNCQWIIAPEKASSITLSFSEFNLENDFDFLYVYGKSDSSTPLYSLTGSSVPDDITILESEITLSFISDAEITSEGWKLTYTSEFNQAILSVELENQWKVFPVPTENQLNIIGNGPADFVLTNLSGQTLTSGTLHDSKTLDVSDYKSGIYLLKVSTSDGSFVKRISKIK
ncbi:MAG: T9SS type A sorting domain-containing protein [Cyclobacteriaceae bacterium]